MTESSTEKKNAFSNDGSFMQQFLQAQKVTVPVVRSRQEEEKLKIEKLEKEKQEKERKEREKIEQEKKHREEIVQQLLEKKKKEEESQVIVESIPKARRKPFVPGQSANSTSNVTQRAPTVQPVTENNVNKRKRAEEQTTPQAPPTKIQKTSKKSKRPRPPSDSKLRTFIQKFAQEVVEVGTILESLFVKNFQNEENLIFLEKDTEQNNYYEFLKQKLCKQKNISQVNQNNDVDSSTPTISEPYENLVKLFQEEFKESEKISLNTELIPNNTEIDGEDPENQMRSFSSFFSNPDPPSTSPQDNLFVSNIGHKMLKNMGWTEGSGLGAHNDGQTAIIEGKVKLDKVGLGVEPANSEQTENKNDPFTDYKKRMKYAYRQRPNPLGNPRQSYY